MRKLCLIAFAAAAMVVTALPSASLARNQAAREKCPAGAADTQYCEHQCPDTVAALQSTVNSAVAAALPAVQKFTRTSAALTFGFVPDACSHFKFRLDFGEPGKNGSVVFFRVGISVVLTTAGTALTVNVPLTGLGRQILARYGASHDTLSVRVTALARQKSNRAVKQAFAQISV